MQFKSQLKFVTLLILSYATAVVLSPPSISGSLTAKPWFTNPVKKESESTSAFVARLKSDNPELGMLCDACYGMSEEIKNAAFQMKVDEKSNPLILQIAGWTTSINAIKLLTEKTNSSTEKNSPHLSRFVCELFNNNFERTAKALLLAYENYVSSAEELQAALKLNRDSTLHASELNPHNAVEWSRDDTFNLVNQVKVARRQLIELVGESAVRNISVTPKLEGSIVNYFNTSDPGLTYLCRGFVRKRLHTKKPITESELILHIANWLPSQNFLAPRVGGVALTDPLLEPNYPTNQGTLPFELPAKAKASKSITISRQYHSASHHHHAIMAETLSNKREQQNETLQFAQIYKRYRNAISSLSRDFEQQQQQRTPLQHLSELKNCRSNLNNLCGNESVIEYENCNHYSAVLKKCDITDDTP